MLITKKKFLFSALMLILGVLQISMLIGITPVRADESLFNTQNILTEVGDNTYAAPKDIKVIAVDVINLVLSFLALVIVILFLIAGFRWMTAGGNEDAVKKAKAQMKNAIIGLIIVVLAWGITRYVVRTVVCLGQSGTTGSSCFNLPD